MLFQLTWLFDELLLDDIVILIMIELGWFDVFYASSFKDDLG